MKEFFPREVSAEHEHVCLNTENKERQLVQTPRRVCNAFDSKQRASPSQKLLAPPWAEVMPSRKAVSKFVHKSAAWMEAKKQAHSLTAELFKHLMLQAWEAVRELPRERCVECTG